MAISASDLLYKLSGGASNSVANNSIGGIISSTQITSAAANNLFDDVSGDESAAGDIEYRCFYIHNNHGSLALQSAVVWLSQLTPAGDSEVDIGLDPAGNGDGSTTGVAATPANESTAPAGVTFSRPTSKGAGLSIGNLAAGAKRAIWIRRTITAGAAAVNNDNCIVRVEGDTAA